MTTETSAELVAAVRRVLAQRRDVRLAVLFGSVARGVASPGSDVDLAVDAPAVDRLVLARDLSLAVGREVDVVDLNDVGYPMLAALVRDGVVVAAHAPGAEARWRTHALITLENDRPWFERMHNAYLARLAAGA